MSEIKSESKQPPLITFNQCSAWKLLWRNHYFTSEHGEKNCFSTLVPAKWQGRFPLPVHQTWGCRQHLPRPGSGSDLILRTAPFGFHFAWLSAVLFVLKGQGAEGLVTIVTVYQAHSLSVKVFSSKQWKTGLSVRVICERTLGCAQQGWRTELGSCAARSNVQNLTAELEVTGTSQLPPGRSATAELLMLNAGSHVKFSLQQGKVNIILFVLQRCAI